MKNALKYGLLMGIVSGAWIILMHLLGVYNQDKNGPFNINWLEYLSLLIPFAALYLGIKNYRNNINGGKLELFEGLIEGFKILLIGFVLYMAVSSFYMQYSGSATLNIDFYQRVGATGLVGILFNVVISLLLMNKQHNL